MKKKIIRYISPDAIELYTLHRKRLEFIKSGRADSAELTNYHTVILSPQNYVKGEIEKSQLNFKPEKRQFLFSNYSALDPDDILFLPAKDDESSGTVQQIWVSQTKIQDILSLLPKAKKFYPDSYLNTDNATNEENLDGLNFTPGKESYFVLSNNRTNKFISYSFIVLCFFVGVAPWFLGHVANVEPSKLLFQNHISLLDNLARMTEVINFPKVDELKINNTLNQLKLTFDSPLSNELLVQLNDYCSSNLCKISFDSQTLNLTIIEGSKDD